MKKIWTYIKTNYKIIVPIVIIAIPFIIFVLSLITASFSSNKVIVGNRFRNDLNPAIENSEISGLKVSIESIDSIESADVILKTSQLRVLANIKDSVTKEEYEEILNNIYSKVNEKLNISTYFTKNSSGEKMYDLEITIYNDLNNDENLIMYSLVKNSTMEEPIINLTSDPKDPELVEELILREKEREEGKDDTPETTPQFEEQLEEETTTEETVTE